MELTPQLLETQQFPEKWRGYDQDAVDEFLERVGVAVAELQDRLRTTSERLRELEAADNAVSAPVASPAPEPVASPTPAPVEAAPVGASTADAQQVARALILAQEAADKAIAEAEAEADSIRSAANDEATRIRSEASVEAKRLTDDAERQFSEAQSKLESADSHVAKLAADALDEARVEADRLTSEANAEASKVVSEARSEAERLVAEARSNAEREAAELIAARSSELADLETLVSNKQAQSDRISIELADREAALRDVVGQLESLVGRFGSLSGESGNSPELPSRPTLTVVDSEPKGNEAPVQAAAPSVVADESAGEPTAEAGDAVVAFDGASGSDTTDPTTVVEAGSSVEDAVSDTVEEPAAAATDFWGDPVDSGNSDDSVAVAEHEAPTEQAVVETESVDDSSGEVAQDDATEDVVIDLTEAETVLAGNAINADSDDVDDLWAEVSSGDSAAVVDDPFLAALRGSDRVEFDGNGEPDDDRSGFRRRRRTRRLT